MLVEDHLRLAAAKVGILSSHPNEEGELVEDDPRRFGFHNLRHSDVKTTLQLYAHSVSEDRMTAQGAMLHAILGAGIGESGLRAD